MASVGTQAHAAGTVGAKVHFTRATAIDLALSLLLVVATVVLYFPVHDHPFCDLDDPKYVVYNPHIHDGLTADSVAWAFTHGYSGNYHPLTWVSHALDISLFGLDPTGHHDENVALHALNALLLFWVLKRATGFTGRSFMVAALFALHPVNVENVAWIAERKTMLSTMFFLLALGAYQWYASRPGKGRYTLVAGLYVLGLWCKPQVIILPCVLLLWDYWPLRRMFATEPGASEGAPEAIAPRTFGALVMEKVPLFAISLVDAAVTVFAQQVGSPKNWYPLWVRLGNAFLSYVLYVQKALWPTHLALYYPHPGLTLSGWQAWGSLLLLLLITAAVIAARKQRYLLMGWLWFLGTLVPMIGLVPVDVQGMADRYGYISYLGLFFMLCWGVADAAKRLRLPAAVLPVTCVLVLLVMSAVARKQISYWQDDVTLWSHAVAVTDRNWKAEAWLGSALEAAKRPDEALAVYYKSAAINPIDPNTNFAIANLEHKAGNLPLALEYYQRTASNPWTRDQKVQTLVRISMVYRSMGDSAHAEEYLQQAKNVPDRPIDWRGAWWKQIIPTLREYLHKKFGG